jgi:hypothetical protein
MEEINTKLNSYSPYLPILEMVSKVFLFLVGLAYVFGFLIVNSYLGSLGIVSIGILKAKYIAAGAVFLLFVCLSGIILYPITLFASNRQPLVKIENVFFAAGSLAFMQYLLVHVAPGTVYLKWGDKWSSVYMVLVIIGSISFILLIISSAVGKLSKMRGPSFFVAMGVMAFLSFEKDVLWVFLSLLSLAFFSGLFISDLRKVKSKSMSITNMVFITVMVVSCSLALCETYAAKLYPKIKNEYGGGKPVSITLLLSENDKLWLKLLFIDDQKTVEIMQDVTLIDEDGEYFFVQKEANKETKTIRIKKSLVNAVIHHKKQNQ